MTKHARGVPLGSWLSERGDDDLVRLLALRPDLAQPPPASIAALAARAQARQSVRAATDELDFLRLAVLDALLELRADSAAVSRAELDALIGERASADMLTEALGDLIERALCWGTPEALQVAAEAGAGLPWQPGQVSREDCGPDTDWIAPALAELDATQRELLDRLVSGSPIGRTRGAAPGTPPQHPVPHLISAGLLRRIDDETVILPRLVGQVLRAEQPGPLTLTQPDPVVSQTTAADVDDAAAGAVIDVLRELDLLLASLSAAPVPELRAGGLGIREVKRLAKTTGVGEARLGLLLEVASAARLIAVGFPDGDGGQDAVWPDADGPYWAPTVLADRFAEQSTAERWHQLAASWLDLPARPGLIGSRDADGKLRAALSTPLYSTAAPLDRRLLLSMLAELPPGAGVSAVSAAQALIWRRPRWASRLQPAPVSELLEEAHALGVLGRGAITSPGRALLADATADYPAAGADSPAAARAPRAVAAMSATLPEPIEHFLVQADLTVVVPGPLKRDLAEQLGRVATVESAGAAMVYRVSEQSLRAALDIGQSGAELHAFFAAHSKTPVPQGLTYLIDDVARRHGQLRVGMAACFVRCEDPALLAQAVAAGASQSLGLRVLAPTVAVAQAPIGEVLAALRPFAPAAEDATGAVVDLRPRGMRVPSPVEPRRRTAGEPRAESLTALVRVLRTVTSAPFDNIRLEPATAMILLKRAAAEGATVLISYVDTAGVATSREVSPVLIRGGQLVAFDSTSGQMRDFTIHRITSISSLGEQ